MPQDLKFQNRCENLKFSNVLVYLKFQYRCVNLKFSNILVYLKFHYRCENLKFSNVLVYLKQYWPHPRNLFCSGSMLRVTKFPCSSPKRCTTKNVTHFPNSAQLSAFSSEIGATKHIFMLCCRPTQETKSPFLLTNVHSSKTMHSMTILFNVITVSVLPTNTEAKYA
jgi:hypothetical protein